eukprot:tig00021621_g22972.t1
MCAGTMFMIEVAPSSSNAYMLHAEALGYGLGRGKDLSAKSLYTFDTASALGCSIWTDEGTSTAMRHDVQLFSFWQRGVAYFASYVRYPSNAVVPRIRLCHFGGTVELPIEENLSSLAPAGYSYEGSAMYKATSWPANAEAVPPGAVAHAMAADGRVEEGGPLVYHAVLRTPFFPTSACPTALSRGLSCPVDVVHVIARWTFGVTFASGAASAQLLRPPSVIHTRAVNWRDTWILQNERPGVAGPGIGALEGKWVEGRRHSFYVLGDEVVRFTRPGAFESGIGGVESGRIRLQPEGWSPSVDGGWYSVPAAAYKSGSLFVVREFHTTGNTLAFPFGRTDGQGGQVWMLSTRLRKVVCRSKSTHLIKIDNADSATFSGPFRTVIPSFAQGIAGAHVLGDFSARAWFNDDPANTGSRPFVEAPFIAFYAREPAFIVKVYTECPPGTTFNAASTGGTVAGENCLPLPPGLYSNRTGLISTAEASVCEAGTFSAGGATAPSICPAGTYSTAGASSCYDCPQNTYSDAPGTACKPCAENAFTQTSKWTSACLTCSPGTYLPYAGAAVCLPCPAFSYSGRGALGSCLPCGPGLVPTADASTCEPCPAGTFQPGNRTACRTCPSQTYSRAGEFGSCTACPEGWTSLEDRQSCIACAAGYYRTSNMSECTRCPINTVANSSGLASCTACPAGQVSSADQSNCIPCPPGTYRAGAMAYCETVPSRAAAAAGSANFTVCAGGWVPSPDLAFCRACPAGSYQRGDSCVRCPSMSVAPLEGMAACEPCENGTVPATDEQSCVACSSGTYRNGSMSWCQSVPLGAVAPIGSSSYRVCAAGEVPNADRSECRPCGKGNFEESLVCRACVGNTYNPVEASRVCIECDGGYYASADKQSCQACLPGQYRARNMSDCETCPVGTYSTGGAAACNPCQPGRVSTGDRTGCEACPAGRYESGGVCVDCPVNAVTPTAGATACTPCGPGTVASLDRQNCDPCAQGSAGRAVGAALVGSRAVGVARAANETSCRQCPFRFYTPAAGASFCTPCPRGTESSDDRAQCRPCSAGFVERDGRCWPCPLGTFSGMGAHEACPRCPRGTTSNEDRTACVPCPPGLYENATFCVPCPAGSVSSPGDVVCTKCEPGTVSNDDRTRCVACPAGTFHGEGQNSCFPCKPGEYAPERTFRACLRCALGSYASADSTRCVLCDAGSHMPNGSSTCEKCPANTFSDLPGRGGDCADCEAGYVASSDRRSCVPCRPGQYREGAMAARWRAPPPPRPAPPPPPPAREEEGTRGLTPVHVRSPPGEVASEEEVSCRECPAGSVPGPDALSCLPCAPNAVAPLPGLSQCQVCPAGRRADDARRECVPCPAGTRMPEGALACEPCGANEVSGPGAAACAACEAGHVSDDGLACAACPAGSFRNASMPACTPCPLGTYAAANGSAVCLACPPRTLCPVATSEPYSLDLSSAALRAAPPPSSGSPASRRARSRSRRGRRRGALDYDEEDVELAEAPFEYGANAGSVSQPVVRTEEETLDRTNRLFGVIGAGAVGATALAGLAAFLYLRVLPAPGPAARAARYRRVQRLHLLFREEFEGDEGPGQGSSEAKPSSPSGAGAPGPEPKRGAGAGADAGGGAPTDEAAPPPPSNRTVSGAVFTLLGAVAVGVALAFVAVQFAVANYSIVQSLNPGVSPSAASIAGSFAFSATFRGYRGPCRAELDASFAPSGFSGRQALSTSPFDAGASCNVTWTCEGCRIASAAGAGVTLRLSSRLAFAVSILYTIKVPEFVTAQGFVQTTREDTVFRGAAPVPLPVALTPMHFTDNDDGRPRYFAALSLAEAAPAERGLDTFALCSPSRPLGAPECSDESVAVAASFRVAEVYVLVDRKLRSTPLDALANAASLAGAALGAAGQALLAYLFVRRLLRRKFGIRAEETDGDVLELAGAAGEGPGPEGERPPRPADGGAEGRRGVGRLWRIGSVEETASSSSSSSRSRSGEAPNVFAAPGGRGDRALALPARHGHESVFAAPASKAARSASEAEAERGGRQRSVPSLGLGVDDRDPDPRGDLCVVQL